METNDAPRLRERTPHIVLSLPAPREASTMNMKRFGITFVLIALLSAPVVVAAQSGYPSGGSAGGGVQIGGGGGSSGDGYQAGMIDVSIVDFAFQPTAIFVNRGQTVEWTNTGNAQHTVDSDTEVFESDILDPGDAYSYTFDEPGIFPYHCDIHPHMRGMVIVTGQ
jgi:plastocyanin